jgi:hypothetical protein
MAPPSSDAASNPPKPVEDFASLAGAEAAGLSDLACEDAPEAAADAEEVGLAAAPLAEPAAPDDAEEDDGVDEEAAPEEGVAAAGLAAVSEPENDGEGAEDVGEACELAEDAPLPVEAAEDAPADGFVPAAAAYGEAEAPGVEPLAGPDAGLGVDWLLVALPAGFDAAPDAAEVCEGEDGDAVEAEELPEDAEAVFAAPTSLACRSMVTGLRPAPAAPLASVAFGSPAFGSAVFEAVLLGSGFLLSAAMNGLSLGSFTGAGYRHGASIARPAASLPLTPLSMFAGLAVQNKFAPRRVSPQAKKSFQHPHITAAAVP